MVDMEITMDPRDLVGRKVLGYESDGRVKWISPISLPIEL